MKRLCIRLAWFTIVAIFPLLIDLNQVSAHGYLIRSIPEDGAVLDRSPARIQYWFSEGLEPQFSSLVVRNQLGDVIAEGGLSPDNNSLLMARLPSNLTDGAYVVDMRIAFASDGHVIAQSRVFFIGETVNGVGQKDALSQVNTVEVIWRTLVLSSTILLLGLCTLYSVVLVPAWGSKNYPIGLLPPRVMNTLNRILGAALIVAFIGNILALLQQSMVFFDATMERVITQKLWSIVRAGTRFGDLWSARMLLLTLVALLFGMSLYWRRKYPDTVRPFWSANAWALFIIVGTFSAGSHAAGSIIWPWVATFNDWLHIITVSVWIGGLVALPLVLPSALAPYQGEQRRHAMLAVMQRFSHLAVYCVVLVIATGIYSALTWIYSTNDLTHTNFGRTLFVKILFVVGLVSIALIHHIALRPARYARWQLYAQKVSGFIPSLRIEALLAFFVIISVGFLSATPVPIPYFIQENIASPSASQQFGDLAITLTITPGGPGVNTYDVYLNSDDEPLDNIDLRLQMISPHRDIRGSWHPLENAEGGVYIGAGPDIDREGVWWSLLDVTLPSGRIQRAAFVWDIQDTAAIQRFQPPRIQHVIALGILLLSLGWALFPFAYSVYLRLDLNPTNMTIVIGAIIGTILLAVVGIVIIQNSDAQYQETLNPTPLLINTNVPDQKSLDSGEKLYTSSCPAWEQDDRFVEQLARIRDEQLFVATRDGWQGSASCQPVLTDDERWNIVNFIRTFQR